jgi:hypothetical protein
VARYLFTVCCVQLIDNKFVSLPISTIAPHIATSVALLRNALELQLTLQLIIVTWHCDVTIGTSGNWTMYIINTIDRVTNIALRQCHRISNDMLIYGHGVYGIVTR